MESAISAIAGPMISQAAGSMFGGGGADAVSGAAGMQSAAAMASIPMLKEYYEKSKLDIDNYLKPLRLSDEFAMTGRTKGQQALMFSQGINPFVGTSDYYKDSKAFYKNNPAELAHLTPDERAAYDRGQDVFSYIGQKQFFQSPFTQILYGNVDPAKLAGMTPEERLANTPGYNILQEQGKKAVERSASAKGYLNSPRVAEEIYKNSAGIAMQQQDRVANLFNNYQDRLSGLTNLNITSQGPALAQKMADMTTGLGNQVANANLAAANAQAQGQVQAAGLQNQNAQNYTGFGNAVGQGISGFLSGGGGGGGELPFPSILGSFY
jgi:hypothetical protein